MVYVKTAVSIERQTFDAGEELARAWHISRSELYTRGIRALLRQRKMEKLRHHIDQAAAAALSEQDERAATAEALHRAAGAAIRGAVERGESTW